MNRVIFHLPFMYDRVSKLTKPLTLTVLWMIPASASLSSSSPKVNHIRCLGSFPADIHLFGTTSQGPLFLMGSDNLGRDMFSRIVFAARVSLFIGLGGVLISFFLGILLGGISGFFGGTVDLLIQRLIEFIISIPQIPLWMGLSAAIPVDWNGIQKFLAIVLILSLVGWTGLARVVRGKIISCAKKITLPPPRYPPPATWQLFSAICCRASPAT